MRWCGHAVFDGRRGVRHGAAGRWRRTRNHKFHWKKFILTAKWKIYSKAHTVSFSSWKKNRCKLFFMKSGALVAQSANCWEWWFWLQRCQKRFSLSLVAIFIVSFLVHVTRQRSSFICSCLFLGVVISIFSIRRRLEIGFVDHWGFVSRVSHWLVQGVHSISLQWQAEYCIVFCTQRHRSWRIRTQIDF